VAAAAAAAAATPHSPAAAPEAGANLGDQDQSSGPSPDYAQELDRAIDASTPNPKFCHLPTCFSSHGLDV